MSSVFICKHFFIIVQTLNWSGNRSIVVNEIKNKKLLNNVNYVVLFLQTILLINWNWTILNQSLNLIYSIKQKNLQIWQKLNTYIKSCWTQKHVRLIYLWFSKKKIHKRYTDTPRYISNKTTRNQDILS